MITKEIVEKVAVLWREKIIFHFPASVCRWGGYIYIFWCQVLSACCIRKI